jgi:histone acetyltransferase (RNA polymerase elongator complex component)
MGKFKPQAYIDVFQGLKFEHNTDVGQNGHLWVDNSCFHTTVKEMKRQNPASSTQTPLPGTRHPVISACYRKSKGRPFIIPIFLPHAGCPHQCVFCNQTAITGVGRNIPTPEALRGQINNFLNYKGKQKKTVQVAFYGGNFLGQPKKDIEYLLYEANKFITAGKVDSIRFSTRPDTIDNERLDMLNGLPVSTVELGVQSMDDQVLAMAKRGHTASDTERAVHRLKKRKYEIGLQLMVGLPGDDEIRSLATGRRVADLSPDFVRIYPTLVLSNSQLAKWYEKGKYIPLSLEAGVTATKKLYLLFAHENIRTIRMGLQISADFEKGATILAGPYHPAFGHLVFSDIFLDRATSVLKSEIIPTDTVSINVHPHSISKMQGLKNRNIEILKRNFHLKSIRIVPDVSLGEDQLAVGSHFRLPGLCR